MQQGEKYGFIDKTGAEVIPLKYDAVSSFSEGMAAVMVGEKFGFINIEGTEVVPLNYDLIGSFTEGMAPVMVGDKFGFIGTGEGETAAPIVTERHMLPVLTDVAEGDFAGDWVAFAVSMDGQVLDSLSTGDVAEASMSIEGADVTFGIGIKSFYLGQVRENKYSGGMEDGSLVVTGQDFLSLENETLMMSLYEDGTLGLSYDVLPGVTIFFKKA